MVLEIIEPIVQHQSQGLPTNGQQLGERIAGAEAYNSEAYSSIVGSTAGEVLATGPIIKAWILGNSPNFAEYGQEGIEEF